jgi:hypothetical protein
VPTTTATGPVASARKSCIRGLKNRPRSQKSWTRCRGLVSYDYVNGDPLNFYDPTGHELTAADGGRCDSQCQHDAAAYQARYNRIIPACGCSYSQFVQNTTSDVAAIRAQADWFSVSNLVSDIEVGGKGAANFGAGFVNGASNALTFGHGTHLSVPFHGAGLGASSVIGDFSGNIDATLASGKLLAAGIGRISEAVRAVRAASAIASASDEATSLSRVAAAAEAGTGAFRAGAEGGEGLGSLAGKSINVSEKGLAQVQEHLAQFGPYAPNEEMVARLGSALSAGEPVTGADASFYMHELTESTLMRQGVGYEEAHAAALAKYGVSPYSVYAPDVVSKFPELFNSNWTEFWGMG